MTFLTGSSRQYVERENGPADGGLLPRAIKTAAPAVIEARSATNTFATRGCFDIGSILEKYPKCNDGDYSQRRAGVVYMINIGGCK